MVDQIIGVNTTENIFSRHEGRTHTQYTHQYTHNQPTNYHYDKTKKSTEFGDENLD